MNSYKSIDYEVLDKNYNLYLNNKIWISNNYANKGLSNEEECLKFIDEIVEGRKHSKIQESKEVLEKYLEENPLFSKAHNADGEYYNATQEKQSLLTQNLMLSQLKQKTKALWNSTGSINEEWTFEELSQLAIEIQEYVQPKIEKQQKYEMQIKSMNTLVEIEELKFDYKKD